MTRAEFHSREAEVEKRLKRAQIVPWMIFMPVYLAMILAIPSLIGFEIYLVAVDGPGADRLRVSIEIVLCLLLALTMQYQLRRARRIAKAGVNELGLVCPACRSSLFRRMSGEGKACPHCGKSVFEVG